MHGEFVILPHSGSKNTLSYKHRYAHGVEPRPLLSDFEPMEENQRLGSVVYFGPRVEYSSLDHFQKEKTDSVPCLDPWLSKHEIGT